MNLTELEIAVVGARGAVGAELLGVLAGAGVEPGRVRACGSEASAGQRLGFGAGTVELVPTSRAALVGADLVFMAAGEEAARRWAPVAVEAGARVVDNSSAFRDDPAVPLVIPEVNGDVLRGYAGRLVANPNCTTVIALLAATPIRRAFGLERMSVTSYQSVSGAGRRAMDELRDQTAAVLAGEAPVPQVFAEPCAFNVFSHDSPVDPETGLNEEERKLVTESAKLWGDDTTRVAATCMRVPVMRAHCTALDLTLAEPARVADAREVLGRAPGLELVDDRGRGDFPTPLKAAGRVVVLVGRLRADPSQAIDADGRACGLQLFAAGDQLLKGAALNAIQIAQLW
ncbi:aspartate-semialdehyde dehydrogenase [Engelhardtia mirabilis]|uniref:Aspartate-semialdehyde dehydrogenase 2 n=1 Tax=Engelhardtia mirabilis TaxID=2528011 RepID=A0A518BIM7_9BACT|nr:Aspartate-semialdehyde dehydrogenase 2 [Planctomycetes bacterium Pla133]QDV01148.1 Aspartate-semialdehyde dehydrogenase 2 [Planctomycetes bacterium Pla86]